jgi:hypothetical protein
VWFLDPPPGPGGLAAGPSTSSGRRLYDEVTTAYQCWDHAGRPPVTQWRFILTPDGQRGELAGITRHEHALATSSVLT